MSFTMKKKDLKAIEQRKAEIIKKCNTIYSEIPGYLQLRSNKFRLTTQKRLEFDVETNEKVRVGTRYILLETINRKLIFRPSDLEALVETLKGTIQKPFSLQLYNDTFRLKFAALEKVRSVNFLKKELETLQAMIDEFIRLCNEYNLFEEVSSE